MRIPFSKHSWSALLVSLAVLILLTIVTTNFLERIWTFSQASKGIEASNFAYYVGEWLIEQQLMHPSVTKYQPWNIQNLVETWGVNTGRLLIASTGSSLVPAIGKWNSPFDSNYNIISLGSPVQLVIPNGINWDYVIFDFRVPKIWTAGTWINTAYNGSGFILWTLGYTGASLFASGEVNIFQGADINTPTTNFGNFNGTSNTGTSMTVTSFYTTPDYLWNSGLNCTWYACTIKLSLIRSVPMIDGRVLPFLEYRITFTGVVVPSQYMTLDTQSYAYGFQRSKSVKIPQITTNTALDFAILQ